MPDRQQSIQPAADTMLRLVVGETLAAAHQLRAIGHRLRWAAECLPLPPDDVRSAVLESTSEEAFASFPALSLFVDLTCIVEDEIFPAAESLQEAAGRVQPERLDV